MIPLLLNATAEGTERFVTRLVNSSGEINSQMDSILLQSSGETLLFSGDRGIFSLTANGLHIFGDVIVVDPLANRAERLIRADSEHNTLLVTERCDQLCVMCSQPPKKTHIDRFAEFKDACLLAPKDTLIGISGGEPTLYKSQLFDLIEHTISERPDLKFHILTNGQHFEKNDQQILKNKIFENVTWGIPLYSSVPTEHDTIVVKDGAFDRLCRSFEYLLGAGAKIELRTVILQDNIQSLRSLAEYVSIHLAFVSQWSIMQLENIGFAKNRFSSLYFDHVHNFEEIGDALDIAELYGVPAVLFNFAKCTIPAPYRRYSTPSISDWKKKFVDSCDICSQKSTCAGFFEWHPHSLIKVNPL